MDLIIGREGDKKETSKEVKKKVKKEEIKVSVQDLLEEMGKHLRNAYAEKPTMEIYDAQVHLDQLRRSLVAAKL